LRLKLESQGTRPKSVATPPTNLISEAVTMFCVFPKSDIGTQFILEHFPRAWVLYDFAKTYWLSPLHQPQDKLFEIGKIFEAVAKHFPTDGRIHKMICLFWDGKGELERAIEHCRLCASLSINDGTVTGFAGRLRRLEMKMARRLNSRNR